jgi:hypothetical protein
VEQAPIPRNSAADKRRQFPVAAAPRRSCPACVKPLARGDGSEGYAVLFMVIESFRPGQAPEVYRRFRDRGRLAPESLRYISSWVDLDFRRCFQVMEAESEAHLKEWTDNWNDLVDFEVIPVRASEHAAAVIAPEL